MTFSGPSSLTMRRYGAVLASQALSNVPAALLLSGFTDNGPHYWLALIWGDWVR